MNAIHCERITCLWNESKHCDNWWCMWLLLLTHFSIMLLMGDNVRINYLLMTMIFTYVFNYFCNPQHDDVMTWKSFPQYLRFATESTNWGSLLFLWCSFDKRLNKWSICWWCQTPWRSCDFILMWVEARMFSNATNTTFYEQLLNMHVSNLLIRQKNISCLTMINPCLLKIRC